MREVRFTPTFEEWRRVARPLLAARVAPASVSWIEKDLNGAPMPIRTARSSADGRAVAPSPVRIPAAFVALAKRVAGHRDPKRWALMYRVAYRLTGGQPRLLEDDQDRDVHALRVLAEGVEREASALPKRPRKPPQREQPLTPVRRARAKPSTNVNQAEAKPARGSRAPLATSAADFLPPPSPAEPQAPPSIATLAEASRGCRGCPLYAPATQTVFGEGPESAKLMLVGEQPGDEEDRRGRPFVGPAGAVLDRVLDELGLDRSAVYVTNAVKHFKFELRGKRRIHQKPNSREVLACKPWIVSEIERIRPRVLVALGGTAAAALFGPSVKPVRDRGKPVASDLAPACFVTYHPSAVLRAIDQEGRQQIEGALRADLSMAAKALRA
jgi:uracil-DNA glycosylase family protein